MNHELYGATFSETNAGIVEDVSHLPLFALVFGIFDSLHLQDQAFDFLFVGSVWIEFKVALPMLDRFVPLFKGRQSLSNAPFFAFSLAPSGKVSGD